MANIDNELSQIKNSIYGNEMRTAIHDGIKKINAEADRVSFLTDETRYEFSVSASGGQYVDIDISPSDKIEFDVLSVSGDYNYVQGYLFKSDGTYTNLYNNGENKWHAGDSTVVTAGEEYNRFRCYVFVNSGEVTVKFAVYKVNEEVYTERIKQLEILSVEKIEQLETLSEDMLKSSQVLKANTDRLAFLTDETRYNFSASENKGYYVDLDIVSGDKIEFDVLSVSGDYNYVQGYLFKSDGTYTNLYNNGENKWHAGDSTVVTAGEEYNRFRCYVFVNSGEVTVKFAVYKVNEEVYTERIKQLEILSSEQIEQLEQLEQLETLSLDTLKSSQALPVNNERISTILSIASMDDLPVNNVYYFNGVTTMGSQPVSSMSGIVYSVQFNRSYNRSGILQYYIEKEAIYYRESSGTETATTWGEWQKIISINHTLNRLSCKIFRKVVCCGDSYTAGHIVDSNGTAHPANFDYAWPHYMETMTGNTWYNCGSSGANCLTWQSREEGLPKALASGKAQAYVIGLGINDAASDTDRYVPIGTSEDMGTDAQTYYGGISAIIRAFAEKSPKAFIFVNTNPNVGYADLPARDATAYNVALRDIVQRYSSIYNVHLIDLAGEYKDLYRNQSLMGGIVSRHFTASGYEQFAEIYAYVLSDYINKHIRAFNDVAFIPFD